MSHLEMHMARNYFLQTTSGHNVKFVKNQPVMVHPACVEAAMEKGAVFVDGSLYEPGETEKRAEIPMGFERDKALYNACQEIAAKASPDDFTAGNVPTLDAMQKALGYSVDRKEVNTAYKKLIVARANRE